MTREDYDLIAEAILSVVHTDLQGDDGYRIYRVADAIAASLKAENPRFNRHQFLEACGLPL